MDFFKSRNFLLSLLVLSVCIVATAMFANYKQKEFKEASRLLDQTHTIIFEIQDLSSQILSLIPLQRAYIWTRNESFKQQYIDKQTEISQAFTKLIEQQGPNAVYTNNIIELQTNYINLVDVLNSNITDPLVDMADTEAIERIRDQIRAVRNKFLDDKYSELDKKIENLGNILKSLVSELLACILFTGIVFILLNYFLFRLRRQNRIIGKDLYNSEERLQYAMLAAGEGVFDLDVKTNYIYCSQYLVEMLGYNPAEFIPSRDMLHTFIYPEDLERVLTLTERYINDEIPEYSVQFRMQHPSKNYIWINARAYAIRDENSKAVRLIGTFRDITEHKNLENSLTQEAIKAEKDSAAKSDFLAHMSHEIRTPLTAISGISEILQKKMDSFDDRQKELITTLISSTKSLKNLVNDILDFSKIEKGEVELENVHFLLGNLISEINSIMSVPANEKGLTLKVVYDDVKYYEYLGDEGRIKQILINLISNAIKFTDDGVITFMASIEKRKGSEVLSFSIQDTGIGINPDMMEYIFKEFKQGDSSISRKYGGTGLGLSISKKLAELMDGNILVESRKGLGSTFTLYLPINGRGFKLIDDEDLKLKSNLNDQLSSVIQEQQCAMLVEDYEGNIVILSYLMEEIGLKYDIARSGIEALKLWKTKQYDIILMDVQMPLMDGLTATKEIRKLEKENNFESTPIVGMTAHALIEDKDKCIEAGMTDYVSKPIHSDILKEKILKYLDKK